MPVDHLIRDKETLKQIADLMTQEIQTPDENIISRYIRVVYDIATFINGQKSMHQYTTSGVNKELMDRGIYTVTSIDDLLPHNIPFIQVARDLQEHRFHFHPKQIPLPSTQEVNIDTIPTQIEMYDKELVQFTKDHPNTRITREFMVDQRIIVNSQGGISIQSIPFFGIKYNHFYEPVPTSRDITVVCPSDEELRRLPELIQFLADPTPEKRIKSASTFSEAFHELYNISNLKYGSLEDAGIPLKGLYDVIVLTGTPAHEVFGHHFEEPIRYLDFGESSTFKFKQDIGNENIVLKDNPNQRVAGFHVLGFTHFDAYGRKRIERTHIQNGKAMEFLGSEYADPEKLRNYLNLEKSEFIGNASQFTDGHFPQPRMSCTFLDGNIENVDLEGKILLVSHEGHTQPSDKTYVVEAKECYIIRDGVPKRLIPLKVTGGINQALANMVLLDDWSYNTGHCGKPEPLYYPNSRGNAQVPVSQFSRIQLWKEQQLYPLPVSDSHLRVLREQRE